MNMLENNNKHYVRVNTKKYKNTLTQFGNKL